MKFNGLFIEEHGSGYLVTLRVYVLASEVEPGMTDDVTTFAVETVANTLAAILAYEGGAIPSKVQAGNPTEAPVEAPAKPEGRRRRGGGGANISSPAEPAASEGAGRVGRRRRAGAADASPTPAEPATPVKEPEPAAPATSRRRPAGSEPAGVSDADLSKAASEAAAVVGAAEVMALLDEFGVSKVNELPQGERREFIGLLADVVEKAGA